MYEALTVKFHGFDPERDLDRELNSKGVHTGGNKGFLEDLTSMPGRVTLRKVVERLQQTNKPTVEHWGWNIICILVQQNNAIGYVKGLNILIFSR